MVGIGACAAGNLTNLEISFDFRHARFAFVRTPHQRLPCAASRTFYREEYGRVPAVASYVPACNSPGRGSARTQHRHRHLTGFLDQQFRRIHISRAKRQDCPGREQAVIFGIELFDLRSTTGTRPSCGPEAPQYRKRLLDFGMVAKDKGLLDYQGCRNAAGR